MSYIRQGQLFSWEEFVEAEDDNTRLVLILDALPDEQLLQWLQQRRKGRRNEYPLAVLWRCIIAKFVYQIKTYAELIRELQRNGSLRRLVGITSRGWVPQDYHFSRFLGMLSTEEGLGHLRQIFAGLVERLSEQIEEFGKHVAIDATAIHAYSNGSKKPISDPHAAWGAGGKTKPGGAGEVEYWLGYLGYVVVDCDSELPLAFDLQPANDSETKRLAPLFYDLRRHHPQLAERIAAVMADRGYDSEANCRYVYQQLEALPIIKMRLPARPDQPCAGADYICNGYGTPLCPSGYRLAYWGRDGDWLKWRCPVAVGQADECRCWGRCSTSDYGAVWKMNVDVDVRRMPGIGRETDKFQRLYNKRSAVERVNGRLKEYLLADDLTIRTLPKVKMHLNLALVVMLAGAWAMVSRQKLHRARQIVRLAA